MTLIVAYQNRGKTVDITIKDADNAVIVPGFNDKIRAIIGREGLLGVDLAGAELVVTSDGATANGSSFTKNSPSSGVNRLRLDASDLAFEPGTYTLFISYYDYDDAAEWKVVDRQVLSVQRT